MPKVVVIFSIREDSGGRTDRKMPPHEILPKKLLHERVEFLGSFSKGNSKLPNIQCIVQFASHKPGQITANVVGERGDAAEISRISELPGAYATLSGEIQQPDTSVISYVSDQAEVVGSLMREYGWPGRYIAAQLHLQSFRITHKFADPLGQLLPISKSRPKRYLSFLLSGPRNIWGVYWHGGRSFDGANSIRVMNSSLGLGANFGLGASIRPWYFYDDFVQEGKAEIQSLVMALVFVTDQPLDQLSDREFEARGVSLANDLTLLASFVSGAKVIWYGYNLRSMNSAVQFVREMDPVSEEDVWNEFSPIGHTPMKDFAKRAARELHRQRQRGTDIDAIIRLYVNALEPGRTPSEIFTLLFLALEKLKDQAAKENKWQSILRKEDFSLVRRRVADLLDEMIKGNPDAGYVKEKLGELNRPSMKRLLEKLFCLLEVPVADLYPPSTDPFTFLSTRNKLFHSYEPVAELELINEAIRLKAIVARLILRRLKWADLSHVPDAWQRRWITTVSATIEPR